MDNTLIHHGVKGQKWGVRRTQAQLARASGQSSKKSVSDMSDDELRTKINRLNMEKQYKDLSKTTSSKGEAFVKDVVVKTGKTLATQVALYYGAKAVNQFIGADVVPVGKNKK